MNEQELRAFLEDLKKSNDEQAAYAKKSFTITMITCIALLIVLAFCVFTIVRVAPAVQTMYADMEASLQNIKTISDQLAAAGLDELVTDVQSLVVNSEKSLNTAVGQLESIDIEELNKAIQNLSDTVEPLANFFNSFR